MQIIEKTYSNGFKLVAVKTKVYRILKFELVTSAGPMFENKEINGISHFVEHLVLEGSENFPDRDKFVEDIDRLGGNYNGYTSAGRLGLTLSLPDSALEYGLDYLADVSFRALFKNESISNERKVVLDELHNRQNGPYRKYSNYWKRVRYEKGFTPLEITGTKQSVKSLDRDTLISWYKKVFVPSNMLLVVVGNFNETELDKLVEDRFGKSKDQENIFTDEARNRTKHTSRAIKALVEEDEKQVIGSITFPTFKFEKDNMLERMALGGFAGLLANYQYSVLFKALRKELGLLYDISASYSCGTVDPGLFEIEFTTSPANLMKVYNVIFTNLRMMLKDGVNSDKLELAKEGTVNSLKMGYDSLGSMLGWVVPKAVNEAKIYSIDEVIDTVNKIDLQLVNNLIHLVLKEDQMNVISRVNSKKLKSEVEKFDFNLDH